MRFQLPLAAVLQLGVSLAAGQLAYEAETDTILCPETKGAYCVDIGASKTASKVVECAAGAILRTIDCNVLLNVDVRPLHAGAICAESSKGAGDAICLYNGNKPHMLIPKELPVSTITEEAFATTLEATAASTLDCVKTTTTVTVEDDDAFEKFAKLQASQTSSLESTTVSFVSGSVYTFLGESTTDGNIRFTINAELKPTAEALNLADVIPDLLSPEEPTIQTHTGIPTGVVTIQTHTDIPTGVVTIQTHTNIPSSISRELTYTTLPTDLVVSVPVILPTTEGQVTHQAPAAIKTVTVYEDAETTTSDDGAESTETDTTAGEEHSVERTMKYLFFSAALAIAMV